MRKERKKELEAVMKAAVDVGAFTGVHEYDALSAYAREKLWWALSCVLQGNGDCCTELDLREALSTDPEDNDDLLLSAYWPLGANWLENALYYFLRADSWSVGVMATYCESAESAENEAELIKMLSFPGTVSDEARRELCRKHFEVLDKSRIGIFHEDECDDGILVMLASERLGEYLSGGRNVQTREVAGLLKKLGACFDDAWTAVCGDAGVVFGLVSSYAPDGCYAAVDVSLLAVGELLDDALDRALNVRKIKKGA